MNPHRALLVTGMHRSGTSLAAGRLQNSGVQMGRQLLPPNRGNPRGYFEDAGLVAFHEQVLQARGLDMLVTAPFVFEPSPAEMAQAQQLVAARAGAPLWGWKDPRTSLFLEFWRSLLPQAVFVLLYRHPLEVFLSLLRRGDFSGHGRLEIGLQSWRVYNQNIANFVKKNRERCLLCHCYSMADQWDRVAARLRQRFGLALPPPAAGQDAQYRPKELRRAALTPHTEDLLRRIDPAAVDLYRRLESLADLPAPTPAAPLPAPELPDPAAKLTGLPTPADAGGRRGLLLLLAAALEPDATQRFYVDLSRSLHTVTTERDQLNNSGALQAYETILNSQDLLTRRWVSLTLTNLAGVALRPRQSLSKLKRWYRFRIKGEQAASD